MGLERAAFGVLPDGMSVEAITLTNERGMDVRLITYGAGIQALRVPDREGRLGDVALGHASLAAYLDHPQYLGSTVGRFANRIAAGRFRLDGDDYQVPINDGDNALHGGPGGFDKANWEIARMDDGPTPGVTLRHVSPDGDQGFPGTLTVTAAYRLHADNSLSADYRAVTDRPTIVGLSNHAYWNLSGEGSAESAMDHLLTIHGDTFLPTDAGAIPTGEFRPVAGTPFDFRAPARIGGRVRDARDDQIRLGRGYDHNWVIGRELADGARPVARLADPASGRVMDLLSNQPGLQFYSGNFLDGTTIGKSNGCYRMGDGVALEPQLFPDTPNRPAFGSARLAPGDIYRNVIVWRFSTDRS